jgi:RHS repeat-associated protein
MDKSLSLPTASLRLVGSSNQVGEALKHLGNVLTTVTDRKIGLDSGSDGIADAYKASVAGVRDYYPFGASIASRTIDGDYRYHFNGKESDSELGFEWQDYGFRFYEEEIGRFLSVDPLTRSYPMLRPYQFASDSTKANIEIDGLESQPSITNIDENGTPIIIPATDNIIIHSVYNYDMPVTAP